MYPADASTSAMVNRWLYRNSLTCIVTHALCHSNINIRYITVMTWNTWYISAQKQLVSTARKSLSKYSSLIRGEKWLSVNWFWKVLQKPFGTRERWREQAINSAISLTLRPSLSPLHLVLIMAQKFPPSHICLSLSIYRQAQTNMVSIVNHII